MLQTPHWLLLVSHRQDSHPVPASGPEGPAREDSHLHLPGPGRPQAPLSTHPVEAQQTEAVPVRCERQVSLVTLSSLQMEQQGHTVCVIKVMILSNMTVNDNWSCHHTYCNRYNQITET